MTHHRGDVILIQPDHLGEVARKADRIGPSGHTRKLTGLDMFDLVLGNASLRRNLLERQPPALARGAQLRAHARRRFRHCVRILRRILGKVLGRRVVHVLFHRRLGSAKKSKRAGRLGVPDLLVTRMNEARGPQVKPQGRT